MRPVEFSKRASVSEAGMSGKKNDVHNVIDVEFEKAVDRTIANTLCVICSLKTA